MPSTYDSIYKKLFAHPELIRDLLLEFTALTDPESLDFATLSRVSGSYVAFRGNAAHGATVTRHSDIVWKVRLAEKDWLYIYLLVEFQATSEKFMALRMQQYIGMLLGELEERKELTRDGKLPPVLPVVLFHGKGAWRAALGLTELMAPAPPVWQPLQPVQRYLLIEEDRVATDAVLETNANLAALWFRLRQAQRPEEVQALLGRLEERLAGQEHAALRQTFAKVLIWLLRRRTDDSTIPDMNDIPEVKDMLAERELEWWERWKLEGEQEGLEKGRDEGRLQGEARVLQRLLTLRFSPLPEYVDAKLATASEDDLLRWSEAVLTASSLEEVFTR